MMMMIWVALWDRAQDIGTLKILIIIIKSYTKQAAVRPFGASLNANRTKKHAGFNRDAPEAQKR